MIITDLLRHPPRRRDRFLMLSRPQMGHVAVWLFGWRLGIVVIWSLWLRSTAHSWYWYGHAGDTQWWRFGALGIVWRKRP